MIKQYSAPQQTLTKILMEMITDHVRKYGEPPSRGFCNHNDYYILANENRYPDIQADDHDYDFRFHGIGFYVVNNPYAKLSLVV